MVQSRTQTTSVLRYNYNRKFQIEFHPSDGGGFTVVAMLPGGRAGVTFEMPVPPNEPPSKFGEKVDKYLSHEIDRYHASLEAEYPATGITDR
jgi:hypothetical protein